MKTINDFKNLLHIDGQNTLLGQHLNHLFSETNTDYKAWVLNFDEKVEVIAQMHRNGIDAFNDGYKLGSVTKAFYQYMLNQYKEY
jgi:hypothetical protein